MSSEYMVMYDKEDEGFFASDKVVAVFRVEGKAMTITSPEESYVEEWGNYVESDPAWDDHAATEAPLSSLFGRSGYTFGEWSPYNDKTKADYEKAVRNLGGTTKTFKPKC